MAYVVRASWQVKAGDEDQVLAAFAALAPLSRQEPGNRVYEAYRDPAAPGAIELFEMYDDEAAFNAHLASEHFQTYALGEIIPRLERRERALFESLG
jgi:quinol monooxygenase YgiN